MRLNLVLLVALAGLASADQTAPASSTASGAAVSIAGVILTLETPPLPVRSATVTLTDVAGRTATQTTETDENGRFSFSDVPTGRYDVAATKPGYLRSSYGMTRPERAGTPVAIVAGQRAPAVTLRMWRGAVITGIVLDARGRPLSGATVSVRRFQGATGTRTIAPATVTSATTDDRGIYRIFGLGPGDYAVFTSSLGAGGRGAGPPPRQITSDDITRALRGARGGAPAPAGAPVPTPPPAPPVYGYAPAYYPGTANAAQAVPVRVEAGEERGGVNFTIDLVPVVTVSGLVAPSPGLPSLSTLTITLRPEARDLVASRSVTMKVGETFTFSSVAPGEYRLIARMTPTPADATTPATSGGWWASAPVSVNGADITGASLALEPAPAVSGRVVFDGTRPPAADAVSVDVRLTRQTAEQTASSSFVAARVTGGERQFALRGLEPGEYLVSATLVSRGAPLTGWTLGGIWIGSRDISDLPITVAPGASLDNLTVRFVDRQTELSGVLQDEAGRPAPDYFVVALPLDRAYLLAGSRRIVSARPATDGRFTIVGLPAGDYGLIVTTDLGPADLDDLSLLTQLVAAPTVKVSLALGARVTQDIRMAK